MIGLVQDIPQFFALHLKIDPVGYNRPPPLMASSGGQRIFIYIRCQYGIQKNIYTSVTKTDTDRHIDK